MSGSLLIQARKDAIKYLTKGGFQENISLETPSKSQIIDITGIYTSHHKSYDTEGSPVNSKSSHILIKEKDLIDANYPYKNPRTGNIDLKKHRILVKNSSNVVQKYIINEAYPSETFGLISCILGQFN